MADPLKLRAEDAEDLAVLSAILQDALVPVGEMVFLPEEQRFVLVANRFRWEPPESGVRQDFERRMSGLRIDGVKACSGAASIRATASGCCCCWRCAPKPGVIYFDFAGGSSIRLEVERILCHLDDLGEPWPTRWRPRHPVEDEAK